MFELLFRNDFWFSSTPLLLVGLLAAVVVLAWDWRISLPALFLVQLGVGQLAVQRSLMPEEWSRVLAWVVVACLLILVLSLLQSNRPAPVGQLGTIFFRLLLLGLAAFLLGSAEVGDLLPLVDGAMARLLLWVAFCAIFAIANADGALESGLALLLWLIGTEAALIAVAPAALVVVLLGALFLLVTLACSYLLVAENVALAEENYPVTDINFPVDTFDNLSTRQPAGITPLGQRFATVRQRIASLRILAQRILAQRGNQP